MRTGRPGGVDEAGLSAAEIAELSRKLSLSLCFVARAKHLQAVVLAHADEALEDEDDEARAELAEIVMADCMRAAAMDAAHWAQVERRLAEAQPHLARYATRAFWDRLLAPGGQQREGAAFLDISNRLLDATARTQLAADVAASCLPDLQCAICTRIAAAEAAWATFAPAPGSLEQELRARIDSALGTLASPLPSSSASASPSPSTP